MCEVAYIIKITTPYAYPNTKALSQFDVYFWFKHKRLAMLLVTVVLILSLPQPTMKIDPATEGPRIPAKVVQKVLPPPKTTVPLGPGTPLQPIPQVIPLLVPHTVAPPKMRFLPGKALLLRRKLFQSGPLSVIFRQMRRFHHSLVRMLTPVKLFLGETLIRPLLQACDQA